MSEKETGGKILVLIDWENLLKSVGLSSPENFSLEAGLDKLKAWLEDIGEPFGFFVFTPPHMVEGYSHIFHRYNFFIILCPKIPSEDSKTVDTTDDTLIKFGRKMIEEVWGLTHLCLASGDNQKILQALQKFIGKELEVKIFDLDHKEEKLILSEKAKKNKEIKEILENYNIGDIVEGEITGIVEFGAFIKFSCLPKTSKKKSDSTDTDKKQKKEEVELEGLIHISELDWQLIKDPAEIVKIGQKVKAKIIEISDGKISL